MPIDSIDSQALLAEMRALATAARGSELNGASETSNSDFSAVLKQAIDIVNTNQQKAAQLSHTFEQGAPGVDLAQVMVAIQKANLSFQAATQVRNRLVAAYQDIMNMPI